MYLTVYRAGKEFGHYQRGGIWYAGSYEEAEYFQRLYHYSGHTRTQIHKSVIEIKNPLMIDVSSIPESLYTFIAIAFVKRAFTDYTPIGKLLAYGTSKRNQYIVEPSQGNPQFNEEAVYANFERELAQLMREHGYDAIIFITHKVPTHIFYIK